MMTPSSLLLFRHIAPARLKAPQSLSKKRNQLQILLRLATSQPTATIKGIDPIPTIRVVQTTPEGEGTMHVKIGIGTVVTEIVMGGIGTVVATEMISAVATMIVAAVMIGMSVGTSGPDMRTAIAEITVAATEIAIGTVPTRRTSTAATVIAQTGKMTSIADIVPTEGTMGTAEIGTAIDTTATRAMIGIETTRSATRVFRQPPPQLRQLPHFRIDTIEVPRTDN